MPYSALIDDQRVFLFGDHTDEVWQRAQQVKQQGRVRCPGCEGELRTRGDDETVARHFFHKRKPDECLLQTGEGPKHERTKLDIAKAVESTGGQASVEYIAEDRSFVVDTLGVWPRPDGTGLYRVAFEVQVSSQTADTTAERTRQRAAECDVTVWVLFRSARDHDLSVPELTLPDWSDRWALHTPHLRVDDELEVVGPVGHEADGTVVQWRTATDLESIVGAIGRQQAVWTPSEGFGDSGGWVTRALAAEIGPKRERAARKRQQEIEARQRHRRNLDLFLQRKDADVSALLEGLVEQGLDPAWMREQEMHARGTPIKAGGVRFLVMPAVNKIYTNRCRAFINSHVVVADDSDDRRRLAAERIHAVTVAEALQESQKRTEQSEKRPQPSPRSRRPRARTWADMEPRLTAAAIAEERRQTTSRLTESITGAGMTFQAGTGWADSSSIAVDGCKLLVLPNPAEVDARDAPAPGSHILLLGEPPSGLDLAFAGSSLRWLTTAQALTLIAAISECAHDPAAGPVGRQPLG